MKLVNVLMKFMAIIVLAIALFGCLNYEQTVKLNYDGSGSLKIHYWTKLTNVMSITKFSFDANEIKNEQYKPEVVKSVKIDTVLQDSTIHVNIELDFADINKLDKVKGFNGNLITFVESGGLKTLTHTLKQDSAARNFGMDEYILRYTYEFQSEPTNVDPNGKVDGKTVKWEYKYSELGNRDIVMTASVKKPSGNYLFIIVVIIVVIVIIIFFVLKSRKPKGELPYTAVGGETEKKENDETTT